MSDLVKTAFLLALLAGLLSGCAGTRSSEAQVSPGHPAMTLTLDTANPDLVKAAILREMQNRGYVLQSISNHRLVFSREMRDMNALLDEVATGKQDEPPVPDLAIPTARIAFLLSKMGATVRVASFCSVTTWAPDGQRQTTDMSANSRWVNALQRILAAVNHDVQERSQ